MEVILLKLNELGIKTVISTDYLTEQACFRTQVTANKNGGQWGMKPIFHKGHSAPEDQLKATIQRLYNRVTETDEPICRGGFTTNGWVPQGDIYTPETHPERFNL
jgi:hypothetical protein